ncbi:unnamed protein product, partial [marine sediment metagenome]
LETLACPSCGATIPHIIGQARAVCPGCQNILTILPQIEHPEKSPSPDLPDSKKREVEQTRGLLQSGSAESGGAIDQPSLDPNEGGAGRPSRRTFMIDLLKGGKK